MPRISVEPPSPSIKESDPVSVNCHMNDDNILYGNRTLKDKRNVGATVCGNNQVFNQSQTNF